MGEMRVSDWSRAKILRSDWLGPIGAIMTTFLHQKFTQLLSFAAIGIFVKCKLLSSFVLYYF